MFWRMKWIQTIYPWPMCFKHRCG